MNRTLLPGVTRRYCWSPIAAGGGWVLHGVFPSASERAVASSRPAPGAGSRREPAGRLRGRRGARAPRRGQPRHHPEGALAPRARSTAGRDDPFFQDFFKQFFGPEGPSGGSEFRRPGLGSGVIFDKRGLVLTNFHVIKGADEITVKLSDKREYRGQILGTDPKTDLAVIRFQPDHELTVATLGNSEALRVGEWAIAIGNPFGLDQTVTVGVISATGRSDVGVATYENFIQTDASINPGNSGGPLLNLKGEVIGINTAIFSQSGGSIGIGFAIPINMVKRVVDQLVDKGKVVRGWLGVSLQPLSAELAESLGVPGKQGAVVALHHGGRTRRGGGAPAERRDPRLRQDAGGGLPPLPAADGRDARRKQDRPAGPAQEAEDRVYPSQSPKRPTMAPPPPRPLHA